MSTSSNYRRDGYQAFVRGGDPHTEAKARNVPLFYVDNFVDGWKQAAAYAAEHDERNEQEEFLYDLSDRLGIEKSDLDRLIEIARQG